MDALLRARGITKSFGGQFLFSALDLEVNPGEAVRLIGSNGSGKSTLLATLAGELAPDAGSVECGGRSARSLTACERETLCPYVEQSPALDLDILAVENLVDSLVLGGGLSAWLGTSRRSLGRSLRERFAPLADQFGLTAALSRPARELSHGQRRLLTIMRALRPRDEGLPRVLLLDEPLAGLAKDRIHPVLTALESRLADGWALIVAEHAGQINQLQFARVVELPAFHG